MSENTDTVERVVSELAIRKDKLSGHIRRRADIAALVANKWGSVWANELEDYELPMVGNLFRTTTEDLGRLFAEQMPTERRYPDKDGPEAAKKAEMVELVLNGITAASGSNDVLEYIGQDMVAAGYAAIKVWPCFKAGSDVPDFPMFRRLNVLTTLPELTWSPDKPTDDVIVNYVEDVDVLQKTAPEVVQSLMEQLAHRRSEKAVTNYGWDLSRMAAAGGLGGGTSPNEPTLEMIDWYSSTEIARVAVLSTDEEAFGALVDRIPNPTGICPVQFALRPTWAQEPLGQLDDAKGPMLVKNRYFRILLDYWIRMVYGGKLVWNVKNPTEIGPDSTYWALGPDAKMEPITPQTPSFAAGQVLGMLESEARQTAVAPESREGNVQLNKATAAFLQRAQGQYSSVVASLQRNYAITKRRLNEAAMAMDEWLCDREKTLTGAARARRFEVTYTPSKLYGGDYSNYVSYGPASGLDLPTHNVLNLNKRQTGNMSLETFLENDPGIDDPARELARLNEDGLRASLLDGLLQPTVPLEQRVRAYQAFQEGRAIEDVLNELAKAQPPAPLPGAGGTPIPLGPTGVPGTPAPQTPLPPVRVLRAVGGARGR